MDSLRAIWLYPIILIAGALQASGPPMNSALRKALVNPWLSSLVSFAPIVAFLGVLVLCLPRPLPSVDSVSQMPWWAPLGGLVGAFAVVVGLLFVAKVGAGAFDLKPDRVKRIQEAAYRRAEERGFGPGAELDDWLAAEREIDQPPR